MQILSLSPFLRTLCIHLQAHWRANPQQKWQFYNPILLQYSRLDYVQVLDLIALIQKTDGFVAAQQITLGKLQKKAYIALHDCNQRLAQSILGRWH